MPVSGTVKTSRNFVDTSSDLADLKSSGLSGGAGTSRAAMRSFSAEEEIS